MRLSLFPRFFALSLVLGVAVTAACTDDGSVTSTVTPAAASPAFLAGEPIQLVATPPRAGATTQPTTLLGAGYPSPSPQPVRTPYVALYSPTPQPATPDPNATPRPVVGPSGGTPLATSVVGTLTLTATAVTPAKSVVLTSQAALSDFLIRGLGQTGGAIATVDFSTQEIYALFDPGSVNGGCIDERAGNLADSGSAISWVLDTQAAAAPCLSALNDPTSFDGDSSADPTDTTASADPFRPSSYTFYAFPKTNESVVGATVWPTPVTATAAATAP